MSSNESCDVYFQDEGIFGRMCNPVGSWVPKKIRPCLPLQRMRQYYYVYAAICPKTGDLFSLIMPGCNAECMEIFLKEFEKYRGGKKSIMIMDNAGWHTTKNLPKLSSILATYLPAYSPELNPVEQLWKHIRNNYTHNHYWDTLEKLQDYLCSVLKALSNSQKTIKSFSLYKWMNYD